MEILLGVDFFIRWWASEEEYIWSFKTFSKEKNIIHHSTVQTAARHKEEDGGSTFPELMEIRVPENFY